MNKTNNPVLPFGSAAYTGKRTAAIVAVLQNKDGLAYQPLLSRLNKTLKVFGESSLATDADLDDLKAAATRLYAVFAATDTEEAAALLNGMLNDYAQAPRLSAHGSSAWHLHVDSSDHAPWAEWFAASSALALAMLLAEKQRKPGGLCASPACGEPFIDLGKGGGRAYCSPRCSTRERVAVYRKKRSDES